MQYKTNSLGYKLSFNGPSTVEEFDKKAGKDGAALEGAVYEEIYRGTLPDWLDAWAVELKKITSIERLVDADATAAAKAKAKDDEARAKVKDVLETVKKYDARVRASVAKGEVAGEDGVIVTLETLQAAAQAVADKIEIDPAPSKREGSAKKDDLDKADEFLGGDQDILEGKISVWTSAVDFDLQRGDDGKPLRESLARLIGKYIGYLKSQL